MGLATLRELWHCWRRKQANQKADRESIRIGNLETLEGRSLLSSSPLFNLVVPADLSGITGPLVPAAPVQEEISFGISQGNAGQETGTTADLARASAGPTDNVALACYHQGRR
jgi:hypothetical protein